MKRRILAVLASVLLLLGLLFETGPSEQKPSPPREPSVVTPETDGLPSMRNFDFSTNAAAAQTSIQSAPIAANESAAPTPTPASITSAPTAMPSSFSAGVANPELKLAVADFPRIFDAYYKTRLVRAEFDSWKGDAASRNKAIAQTHAQIVTELKQVILAYSVAHGLDAVLDAGSIMPTSGDPLVLYAHPGMDITDGVTALANAGHEEN